MPGTGAMGLGTFVDVDDVGSLHAARLHLGGGGGPSAGIYSRQLVLYVTRTLCAAGNASADIGNAVHEERAQNWCGAGQYFVHMSTPSHCYVF